MSTHTSSPFSSANVDPAELAKFSDLAHRWWDTESEFRPLHQINPLRLNWIQSLAPLAGKKVVDIGCGGGRFHTATLLASRNFRHPANWPNVLEEDRLTDLILKRSGNPNL